MSIETAEELKGLRLVGRVVARTLALLRERVRAGMTTRELDDIAAEFMAGEGARSAPRLVYRFPGSVCISINDEAVHGVPTDRVIRVGDMVTFDVTAELDGYFADAAITVTVPPASPQAEKLRECAEAAFWKALHHARAGQPLAQLGATVEAEVNRRGFHVLRDLCGHGIGRTIHEEPNVPNHFVSSERRRLGRGLVIALEPIISAGTTRTRVGRDHWTVYSADGSLTSHFEHTIVVTKSAPIIVTAA